MRSLILILLTLALLPGVLPVLAQQPQPEKKAVAWIGVTLRSADGEAAEETPGALITGVVRESPADDAGLRGGDLVKEVGGVPVTGTREFISRVQEYNPGDWIDLKISRDGRDKTLSARLDTRPDRRRMRDIKRAWAGFLPVDVPEQLREFWGGGEKSGVLVGEVAEGSPAQVAGLLPGDLVLSIGGAEIADARQLLRRIAESGVDNTVEMEISRQGTLLEIEVDLSEPPVEIDKRPRRKDS